MKIDYEIDFSRERITPFRIFGNLYYVGARFGTSHLIDTGAGLILLDTGLPQTLHLIVQGMWELGFDPRDIRYILHSHGHYDHIGGTKALKALSGAVTLIGAGDEDFVNGKRDLTWARELGYRYDETFEADVILRDGDTVELGNTKITCLSTPGHSPGCLSFFFHVGDGKTRYRAGMHGGVGVNAMTKEFLDEYGLSYDCREQFLSGLERLKQERVDLVLGNHINNNRLEEKYRRMQAGGPNPFLDNREWISFLEQCRKNLLDLMENEK